MNNNIIIGGIIALAAIIGIIFYMTSRPSAPIVVDTTVTPGDTNAPTPTPSAPKVVTDTSTSISDTTAVLTGVVTPQGAFTSYWYEYGTSQSLGSKITNQALGSGYSAIRAPGYVTGLIKDTTYFYRLVAENQYGKVEGGTYSFKTSSGVVAPVGSSPTIKTLAATGVTRVSANLSGSVTPNKASTTYWFEYGKTVDLGSVTPFLSIGNGTQELSASASLVSLSPNTTYYYRLDAQNQFGTVVGTILTFKTLAPSATDTAAPTVVTRNTSAVASSSAVLHGSVTPNGLDTNYWFEYSIDPLLPTATLFSTSHVSLASTSKATAVTATATLLTSKVTYYFRLVAQNSLGTVKGDSVSFKTK